MKKSERLNQELIFLSGKSSFQLKDLIEEFNISKRTAIRDIKELENMGLTIYVDQGRYGGYKIINQNLLTPIHFNNDEILAIFFALKSLNSLSSTPFNKTYKQIREKLYATLPKYAQDNLKKTLSFIEYYTPDIMNNFNYLSDILYSIMYEQMIEISYSTSKSRSFHFQVYELFYRNGIWFIEGFDLSNEKWGIFRCDYIAALVIKDTQKNLLSRTQLENYKKQYDESYRNIPFKCQLNEDGVESFKKNHYPSMHLEYIDHIPFIIGFYNEDELEYMIRYLISLGQNVKIIYPAQLKTNYLNALKSIISSYE